MQFLEILADQFIKLPAEQLTDATVLLPNRRSGQYLIRTLSQKIDKPIWLPQILTLEDWVVQGSGLELADSIYLNFKLFGIYRQFLNKEETFEDFYPYGEMLLKAFDLVDRHLLQMEQVCKVWRERTAIDLAFGDALTEEQKSFLQEFWLNVDLAKQSFQKEKFLEELHVLPSIYKQFQQQLAEELLCYPGLAYKTTSQKLAKPRHDLFLVACHVLEPSTLQILKPWHDKNLLHCFWNFPEGREMFSIEGWHQYHILEKSGWIKNYLPKLETQNSTTKPAEVDIIGATLGIGQAQAAAKVLENSKFPESVCLILPDPALLPALFQALPENLPEFNVTMGYPLRLSLAYSWCLNLIQFGMAVEHETKKQEIDISKLVSCLKHPFLTGNHPAQLFAQQLSSFVGLRIPAEELPLELKFILWKDNSISWPDFLYQSLEILLKGNEKLSELERNLLAVLQHRLEMLAASFAQLELPWSASGFLKLFSKLAGMASAPFEGLPLAGLQVMGLLESQCLNFDHVVLLSANEDIFPTKSDAPGFFPWSLHKAFRLPLPVDQQNRTLEVFYTLMMRAKKVTLIFNQVSHDQQPAEPSRVIEQIRYEWPGSISEASAALPFRLKSDDELVVYKSPAIMEKIEAYCSVGNAAPAKTFSPASINTWLDCSLKFYFTKILKEEPIDDEREELGANQLGSLLHVAMENIYGLVEQSETGVIHVTSLLVEKAKTKVESALQIAFKQVYGIDDLDKLSGLLILAKTITQKYVRILLEADLKMAPFDIVGLEFKNMAKTVQLPLSGKKVSITGIIDRIDKKGNEVRIADYKTGDVNAVVTDLEQMFAWNRKKETNLPLQGFVYGMLFEQNLQAGEQMKVELVSLRNMFDQQGKKQEKGIVGIKGSQNAPIQELIPSFEAKLAESLEPLFDVSQAFFQTEDILKCTYCNYKNICRRG
jgi:hypothetical protein